MISWVLGPAAFDQIVDRVREPRTDLRPGKWREDNLEISSRWDIEHMDPLAVPKRDQTGRT